MTMTQDDRPTVPETEVPSPAPEPEVVEETRQEREERQAAEGAETLEALAAEHVDGARIIPGVGLAIVPAQEEMRGMAAMAVTLAGANALPAALRGRPNDVFLILLTARDLNVALTTAIREFHIIDGKVTLSPKAKLAMVNERGAREGWAIWPDPANNGNRERATWYATRADRPGVTYASTFTIEDAKGANLTGKDKSAWKTYPQRMLSWRALGYLLDDAFPEVGTGLYSPDEMGAITDEEGSVIDVDAIDPLDGMNDPRRGRNAPAGPPEPATDEDKAELRRRVTALPEGGQDAVRDAVLATREREGVEPLVSIDKLIARQLPRWRAIVDAVERRAKGGEWGEWTPPADPETGEVADDAGTPDEQAGSTPETGDAETAAEPPEGPPATDLHPDEPDASESVIEPSETQPEEAGDPRETILEQVIAEVKAMPASKVLAELVRRAIEPPTADNKDEQRAERQRVLAERLFRERTGETPAP